MQTITGTDINKAKHFLQQGEVVGIPTETVYGLAANALNTDAVLKIFTVKKRPHFDPLIVHTHSITEVEKYVQHLPAAAQKLMHAFMPGPLTVLLPKQDIVPDLVTSGLPNVAIRIPDHALTLQLLRSLPFPLAAPSANPFGYISPTTAQHVFDQLQGQVPYILDGGATQVGVESTIVGFENNQVVVYRLGGLAIEQLAQVAGPVKLNVIESANPQSPGQLKSHYAPRKPLVVKNFDEAAATGEADKVGVIAFDTYVAGIDTQNQLLLSPSGNLNEAAKNLFAAMRQLDNSTVDYIIAVRFPETGLGRAINDRLKRASAN